MKVSSISKKSEPSRGNYIWFLVRESSIGTTGEKIHDVSHGDLHCDPSPLYRACDSNIYPVNHTEATISNSVATNTGKSYANHSLDALINELERLRRLPSNWDSYGAEAPNATAVESARHILEFLARENFDPSRVMPSVENGIAIVFKNGDRYADIECFNDGDIAAMLMDNHGVKHVFSLSSENREITEAVDKIRAFIQA